MWRPTNTPTTSNIRFIFLDKLGWPVETVKGHLIQNLIRLFLRTRGIRVVRLRKERVHFLDSDEVWDSEWADLLRGVPSEEPPYDGGSQTE